MADESLTDEDLMVLRRLQGGQKPETRAEALLLFKLSDRGYVDYNSTFNTFSVSERGLEALTEPQSLYEQALTDPRTRAELSLAKMTLEFPNMIVSAMRETGTTPDVLAEAMGVPTERVLGLLDSEDDEHIITFEAVVRYMSLMGYSLKIVATRDNGVEEQS